MALFAGSGQARMSGAQAAAAREGMARMQRELVAAIDGLSRQDLLGLARFSLQHTGGAAGRRLRNVAGLVHTVGKGAAVVTGHLVGMTRKNGGDESAEALGRMIGRGIRRVEGGYDSAREVVVALRSNPKEALPQLLTTVIVALLVSGGPDGDGGVPDLDLMVGIGAHRSWLSHSIVAGAVLEGLLRTLLEMVRIVHAKLPQERAPLWDVLYLHAAELTEAANRGASIGLAYHLVVDGLAQPAPYHGLPVSMPIEAHQALFTANGAAEALDATKKPKLEPEAPRVAPTPASVRSPAPAPSQAAPRGRAKPAADVEDVVPREAGTQRAAEPGLPAPPWRDTASAGDLHAMQLAHKEHRQRSFALGTQIRHRFTTEERGLLERYGAWMKGLAEGRLQALTAEQEEFVAAAAGHVVPGNKFAVVWVKYRAVWKASVPRTRNA